MHTKRARTPALLVALCAAAVACGPRIPADVAVAANSQVLEEERVTVESTEGFQTGGAIDVTTGVTGDADNGVVGGPGPGRTTAPDPRAQPTTGPTQDPGGPVGTPGETGPIRIASVGNYSGPAGPPQAGFVESIQIWAQYINDQGGLFGRPIELFVIDDKSDPAQHLAAVKDMVENKQVHTFLMNAAALTADASRAYLREQNVPVVSGDCALTWYNDEPWYFSHCQRVEHQFYGIFHNGKRFGDTIAMFYCREASVCSDGNDKLHDFKDEIGLEVVYETQVLLTQLDFTSECRSAKDAGAELLFVLVDPTGVERAASSCARQEYFPTFVQGSSTVFHETKDLIENLVVELPAFPFVGADTPARNEFQQVMAAYLGKPPGPANSHGWAAAKLLEKGLIEAARLHESISRDTLIATFRTFENEDLGGLTVPLTFMESGTDAADCWFSVQASSGTWSTLNDGKPICR